MAYENDIIYLSYRKLCNAVSEYSSLSSALDRWLVIVDDDNTKQYYSNSGQAEEARFDRVVTFLNNDFDELQTKTATTGATLETAMTKAAGLICSCEEFPEVLMGSAAHGPVFYESVNAAPPVDELLFNDEHCNVDSYAGSISDETDAITQARSDQTEAITNVRNELKNLDIIEVNVDSYLSVVEECNDKEAGVEKLFSAFKIFIAGVKGLNATVVNALTPLIDPEEERFHIRDYKYTGGEAPAGSVLARVSTDNKESLVKTYGTVDAQNFIIIREKMPDGTEKTYYGGNQGWFEGTGYWDWIKLDNNGCGVMAAVNQYLYLTGQTDISKDYYMALCKYFMVGGDKMDDVSILDPMSVIRWESTMASRTAEVASPAGAFPWEMTNYVSNMCGDKNVTVLSAWDFFQGYETDYNNMKTQLENGVPVIWAVHDWDNAFKDSKDPSLERCTFYTKNTDGSYTSTPGAASHYVTVTGIIEDYTTEDHNRMVVISSWGNQYYVDYDEYVDYVSKNGANQPFSSITNTVVIN